jgi:superkiller protein 3
LVGAQGPELTAADRAAIAQANKFIERGNEFANKDSLARAKGEYLRALKLFPRHLDGLYNIAVVCTRLGQRDEAIGYYKEYLALQPGSADVWTQLGVLYDEAGQVAEARVAYGKALEIDPKFGRAHHNLGVLFKEQGDWNQAEKHLQQFVELAEAAGERNGEAYYSLGVFYLNRLQPKNAKVQLQRALDTDPSSALFNNAMGDAYLLEKDAKVAQVYFQKAIAKDGKFALAYSGLGDSYQQLGQVDEAARNYRKALELRPDYPVVHYKLGVLYETSQPVEAIKHFEKYLQSGKNLALEREAREKLAKLKNVAPTKN